jgi:putative SOS response-associated peptidase YedK
MDPRNVHAEDAYVSSVDQFPGSWNVTPMHQMPITRLINGEIEHTTARWSLLPYWAKDEKLKYATHNARADKIATAPSFRGPYRRKQRCLVPAAGFYEWKMTADGKQPYHVVAADASLLVFAGLWDVWRRADGNTITTFTIATTEPSDMISKIHDRMPVILEPENYSAWLEADDPSGLLRPAHNERLFAYAVDRAVGKVANNYASLIEPLEDADRRYLQQMQAT